DEHTLQASDLNDPPKRLRNTKTQAEQNLSKKEKPKMDSDDPPELATEKRKRTKVLPMCSDRSVTYVPVHTPPGRPFGSDSNLDKPGEGARRGSGDPPHRATRLEIEP
ncbi:MAG TPA: hypothetical protein VIX89_14900, partial [Bryobacteraceae bacterium]